MILNRNGEINEYYIQTLCMLFFPGEKFSAAKQTDAESPSASVSIEESVDGITAKVNISHLVNNVERSFFEPFSDSETLDKTRKIAVGKAFFNAGKKLVGKVPQWGILTGVRPAKLALQELMNGATKAEVRSIFTKEYFVNAKKAALACDTAYLEKKIIAVAPENACSIYISIPFCPSRCSYCSFVSYTSPKLLGLLDGYLEQLCRDIAEQAALIKSLGLTVATVYIGGGTPTTLSATQLEKLLSVISENVDMSGVEEFTVEAGRPDTITKEKLEIIKKYGATRISINTQTLNDEVLELIGRKHTAADFYRAFELARSIGIPQINTDLIAGLPGEGFGSFSSTVDEMTRLHPENLTVHTLCIKNAADFSQKRSYIYDRGENVATKLVDYAHLAVKNAGYIPYYMYRQKNTVDNLENVGFCLPGCEGKYNIYMMEEIHSIFAIGAGAVSKLVDRKSGKIDRIFEYKYPYEYLSDENEQREKDKKEKIISFYNNIS